MQVTEVCIPITTRIQILLFMIVCSIITGYALARYWWDKNHERMGYIQKWKLCEIVFCDYCPHEYYIKKYGKNCN